jgi:gluconate kinase
MQGLPGSGKTTLTHSIAQQFPSLQPFDFDVVMPAEYKEKMKNGQALTQEEREILFQKVYATLDGMPRSVVFFFLF